MVDFDVNIKLSANSAAQAIADIQGGLDNVERSAKGAENALDGMGGSSRTFRKIEQELKSVEEALKDVEVGSDSFKELARSARVLDGELESARRSVQGVGDEFSVFGEIASGALRKIGEIGIEAIGAGIQFLGNQAVESISKFSDYQQSMLVIEQQIKTTGGAAGITAEEIRGLSESISSNTQASITDVTAASQILLSYTNVTGDMFEETIRLSQDFMTVLKPITGDELPDAVERLGEALQSPIAGLEGLEEAKIYFTDSEKEVIKAMEESGQLAEAQAIILDKVKQSMAGVAEASGEGVAGGMAEMNKSLENAQLLLGEALSPAITAATHFMADFVTELLGGTTGAEGLSSGSEKLAEKIKSVDVGKLVSDLKQLTEVAADVASAISKVIGFLQQLNQYNPAVLLARGAGTLAGEIYGARSTSRSPINARTANMNRRAYSTGGLVTGGGGGSTADDIPILVSSGEYVINADAVRAAGKEYLDTINSGQTNIGALRASPSMMSGGGDATAAAGAFGQKMGEALQGFYRQGNIGPTSTGAHFDIKRQDKSRFERTDLDQYVSINGNKSLSSGTTVRGGEFGARRSYGSHNGWDFAFGGQADLSLKNGAQWVGNKKTQHGDKASFMTPDGKVYEILHGTFQGQAKPMAPVSAAQTVANTPSASKAVGIASTLKAQLDLTDAQAAGIVGNFMREAGNDLNPRINEGGKVGLPMGRGGYGLAQWTGSRQNDLVNFAGGKEAAGSLEKQVAFTIKELLGTEKNALAKLKQTNTPEEAAASFEKYYERAGVVALGERQANARQVYGEIQSGAPLSGGGFEMGYTDAQKEHNKAVDEAANSIARQTERLAENVAESQLRNVGLKMQLDLLRQTSDEDKDAAKIVEHQLEQGVNRVKLEEELKQKLEAKLLTEKEVTMTLEKFDELQTKKITAMKEEKAILADLESLQAFNEEWRQFAEASAASVETSGDRVARLEQEAALVQSGVENYSQALTMLQAEMELKQQLLEIQTQLNDQLERGNVTQEQASEILANAEAAGQAKLEGLQAEIHATNTLSAAQEVQSENRAKQAEVEATYQQLIDNATGAFTNFATSVLSGSESAGEAVKKLATTILSNLANKAMSSLFGSLFGGLFGGGGGGGGGLAVGLGGGGLTIPSLFADGGIVDRPTNAIIGEAGAEAVIPLKGGMVPVKMMGGGGGDVTNITVNVSSSQGGGEGQDGRVLGRQISEAIKAEIANQKRSGGLLR